MRRFTALAAEARTAVFRAPAVISGDPWRTLGGPLGSVKMEKTWGKYFLKPPRMGVCVPRYPALLSGPRIVRAEGSEVKGGGRGGWIYPPPWLWYVLREAWDPRMFLFDSFLFLVGPPSEQKKGGRRVFVSVLRAYGCSSTCWRRKRCIFRRLEILFVVSRKKLPKTQCRN